MSVSKIVLPGLEGKVEDIFCKKNYFFLLNWSVNKLEKVLMSLRENYVPKHKN
jgi:hypothetical protein